MFKNQLPRITNTESIIMKILLDKAGTEIYGWELIESSEGKLKRGTIYVILNRMEDKGFIVSRKESRREGARGQPRRMYKLTGEGRRTISAWEMISDKYMEGII